MIWIKYQQCKSCDLFILLGLDTSLQKSGKHLLQKSNRVIGMIFYQMVQFVLGFHIVWSNNHKTIDWFWIVLKIDLISDDIRFSQVHISMIMRFFLKWLNFFIIFLQILTLFWCINSLLPQALTHTYLSGGKWLIIIPHSPICTLWFILLQICPYCPYIIPHGLMATKT